MADISEFCGDITNVSVAGIQENHEIIVVGGGVTYHTVSAELTFTNGDGQGFSAKLSAYRDDDSLSRIFTGTGLKSYRLTLEEV